MKVFRSDRHLLLILLLSAVYFSYWVLYMNAAYSKFQAPYYDYGIILYSVYWHVHVVQLVNPLQYLVFYGHLAPFSLLLVPIFALFPYPMSFAVLQGIFLAAATILAYVVSRELTKNNRLSFVLALAFLLNPAIIGVAQSGFHNEAVVPLFYLLAFYFYMKEKNSYFFVSYILLLSIIEWAFAVGVSLILALFIFERFYNRRDDKKNDLHYRKRVRVLGIALALSIVSFFAYTLLSEYIIGTYASTPASLIAPLVRLHSYEIFGQAQAVLSPSLVAYDSSLISNGILGALVLFLGFGVLSLVVPLLSVILYAPWIAEVFIIRNPAFPVFFNQYYTFFLGAGLVSALLGYQVLLRSKTHWLSGILKQGATMPKILMISAIIYSALPITALMLWLLYPTAFSSSQINYTQISQAISIIPGNSSVMAQSSIAPHLYYMRELELAPTDSPGWFMPTNITVFWTKPDYIVFDKKLPFYSDLVNYTFNVYAYMGSNYTTLYNVSGLYVFKKVK